ncbi:unnamed protein product [Rangifer tarandus platyrhynchus]|uniref:Uncharacterized protein n=1 Tax=Rangifer tarandus platyrhynchus TaxID=3082113 RepID=A0ABN8YKK1_RANTA|nr:unnamed protein product [Rangifer tarandus platyrhynchus]
MTEQGLLSKRKPTPDFQRHLNAENYYEEQIKLDQRTGEVREGRLQGPLRGLVPAGTQLAKEAGQAIPCCTLHPRAASGGLGTTSEADGSWRSGIWQPRRIEWKERVRVFQREEQAVWNRREAAQKWVMEVLRFQLSLLISSPQTLATLMFSVPRLPHQQGDGTAVPVEHPEPTSVLGSLKL